MSPFRLTDLYSVLSALTLRPIPPAASPDYKAGIQPGCLYLLEAPCHQRSPRP